MGHHKVNPIHITRDREGEEREKGAESLFKEILAENFPNLGKETNIQSKKPKEYQTKWI